MNNLSKVLKAAGNDDTVTLKTDESSDRLSIMFESRGTCTCCGTLYPTHSRKFL